MPLATDKTPEPISFIDWDDFKVQMLTHPTYQRVTAFAEALVVSRIEAYFVAQAENWPLAAGLWKLMLDAVDSQYQPTTSEVAEWQQIATDARMPFTFSEAGYLVPEVTDNDG